MVEMIEDALVQVFQPCDCSVSDTMTEFPSREQDGDEEHREWENAQLRRNVGNEDGRETTAPVSVFRADFAPRPAS